MLDLIRPRVDCLLSYQDALAQGWSPDNVSGPQTNAKEMRAIASDPEAFLASLDDPDAKNGPITLPDGTVVARLPGFRRWMWDGEFCGSFGFRWQKGSSELPPHCLGHIGYSTVPWKRGKGYTKQALALLLEEIKPLGMPYVEITTEVDNIASQKVVLANGGILHERFVKPPAYQEGDSESLKYRIYFTPPLDL